MKECHKQDRAWIEINGAHLEHNVCELKKIMPKTCELMAVVKADAYGHGAVRIAEQLNRIGVRAFAVATLDEGIRLRKAGICGLILILGYTSPERIHEIQTYDLTQTVVDYDHAIALSEKQVSIHVHLKIDTGMHRLGIPFDSIREIQSVLHMNSLEVTGIYSHFACADSREENDILFTKLQTARFQTLAASLKQAGLALPKCHIQSTYGLLNYPDLEYDYIRCGLSLYGVLSAASDRTVISPDLKPVLSVKARVIHLQKLKKGESIGYGRACTLQRDSRIATVSIGYGDGLPRNLYQIAAGVAWTDCQKGDREPSLVSDGKIAPFAGRLSMDQLTVDVTELEGIRVGSVVTVIEDREGSVLSAPYLAEQAGTITNELLSRLGARLKDGG